MNKPLQLLAVILIMGAIVFWLNQSPEPTKTAGTPMITVNVPNFSKEALAGEGLFKENCAACHGKNAAGNNSAGPPLVHKIYEPSHHGDIAFQFAVKNGVRTHHWKFGNMPPVEGLSEVNVLKIIKYVRALQRENGIN